MSRGTNRERYSGKQVRQKMKSKKDRNCLPIDVAKPSVRNVIQKESEKKLKYKNLSIEIQRM
jgi:hypothetical protein